MIEVIPAITFTFTGLMIDPHARVLDESGEPIPGLLAAGADAGGVFDRAYAGGLACALVFGLQAAATATAQSAPPPRYGRGRRPHPGRDRPARAGPRRVVGPVARSSPSTRSAAGIDHLTVGDHVSFADGHGADGLIQATALLSAHPRLSVQTGVYLLALRHPAVVARQLATIALLAPGRFTFGVGVGGDDPRELELCGIDPRERGARTTEALRCVRAFMTGEDVDFRGSVLRPPGRDPSRPVVADPDPRGRSVGRGARAHRRSSGDGWLALWISPRRFEEAIARIETTAAEAGRSGVRWKHALQLWAGFGASIARRRGSGSAPRWKPRTRSRSNGSSGTRRVVRPPRSPRRSLRTSTVGCRSFNFVPEATSLRPQSRPWLR